jgi:hypothetical protein
MPLDSSLYTFGDWHEESVTVSTRFGIRSSRDDALMDSFIANSLLFLLLLPELCTHFNKLCLDSPLLAK